MRFDINISLCNFVLIFGTNGWTGSAWAEYKKTGTVHGVKVREGYDESSKLVEPLFTPSTKADQGEHDENISPSRGVFSLPLRTKRNPADFE